MFFNDTSFVAFGLTHGVAVLVVLLTGVALMRIVRKKPDEAHLSMRWILGIILGYTSVSGMVNLFLRHGSQAGVYIHEDGYPLYLCDVVAIVLAIALIKKSQRLTEIGYAWALAGTVQGLLTPVLAYEWPAIEFICFFIQHGLGPIVAILLVWGFGLRPQKGAYKRIWIWTWVYMAFVMIFNYFASTNYSFLNGKPAAATALDYLGDYPWYLVSLHALAAAVFFLLLLPFRKEFVGEAR